MPNVAGAMNSFASKQPHLQVHQQAQGFPGTSNNNNLQSPVQQQFQGALSQQLPLGQHFVPNSLNPQRTHTRAKVRLLQRPLCLGRRLEAPNENSAWKGPLS